MMRSLSVALVTTSLAVCLACPARAQTPPLPQTYSFEGTASMLMPGLKVVVHRNGSRELIERVLPGQAGTAQLHDRVLYDFEGHKVYTRDLLANRCTVQRYESPYAPMFDPIGGAEEQIAQMAKAPPRVVRRETVNGIPARVVEDRLEGGDGKYRAWLEEKYGFPVRMEIVLAGQPPVVALELAQLSYAPSPATLFVPPTACTPVGGVATATGGHAEATVDVQVPTQTVDLQTGRTSGETPQASVAPVAAGQITAVRLRLVPERYAGPCPGKVKLLAEISTDGPGTVWYHVMAGAVSSSPEGRLTFTRAGTQTVTVQGAFNVAPAVPEAGLIAAMEDAAGQRGETVSADPVPYNIRCTGRAGAAQTRPR